MPIIDARDLPGDSEIVADLVVIGAGMAGLAIAREWAGSGRTVALIESGGRDADPAIQDLYAGTGVMRGPDNPDRPFDAYLVQSRQRQLGGSGMIWGGKCAPLDPADFAARGWIPGSGWPVTRAGLRPFYDRACDLLEIPRFGPGETGLQEADRPQLALGGGRAFFSAPRHYSRCSGRIPGGAYERYRTQPLAAANVTAWLHANVTEIRLAKDGRAVERLDIACLNGRRHRARGRAYVLATGGIENARLLLASASVERGGVGNRAGLVGRYFQGHVTFGLTDVAGGRVSGVYLAGAPRNVSLYTDGLTGKSHCVHGATLVLQRRLRTGNFTLTLGRLPAGAPDPEDTVLQQMAGGVDAGQVTARPDQRLYGYFMSEHLPNPDSRITLGSATDALGMPRTRLEWRWSAADWRNLEANIAVLAAEMAADGLGRVCFPAERAGLVALASPSRHHMGATRMHADPARGVVDADCRVHGVANLYVAGSSVFPTSGIANPTLTLLALAMRLSDHLKTEPWRTA